MTRRKSRRSLSNEDCVTIAFMLSDGCSYTEIGRAIGRHNSVVARYCIKSGLSEHSTRRVLSRAERAKIVALYAEHDVPVAVIQARFGIYPTTLYRVLREENVPLRRPNLSFIISARMRGRRARPAQEAPAP